MSTLPSYPLSRNFTFASEVPLLAQIAAQGKIVSIAGSLEPYRSQADPSSGKNDSKS
jgi:hypothetical protein